MKTFTLIGYSKFGDDRWINEKQSTFTAIYQEVKGIFSVNTYLKRLDVFDDSDNLLFQFIR